MLHTRSQARRRRPLLGLPHSHQARKLPDEPPPPLPTQTRHIEDQAQPRPRKLPVTVTQHRPTPQRPHARPVQRPIATKTVFKILQLNVYEMLRRASEVLMQCSERGIAAACFQETHLKQGEIAPRMQHFTVVTRHDREDGYGGTITYFRNGMKGKVLSYDRFWSGGIQMCSVLIWSRKGVLRIANV